MLRSCLRVVVFVGVALTGLFQVESAAAVEQCPEGWVIVPTVQVCAPKAMQGSDGSFSEFVRPLGSSGSAVPPCPEGWFKPPGLNLCIPRQITVNALGSLPIIEMQPTRFCPEGFHRFAGSTLCIASNLQVARQSSGAVQVLGPTRDCPTGFVRPTGSTVCVADNAAAPSAVLAPPAGPRCPAGFHRPPGVPWCVARHMVYTAAPPSEHVPAGRCPKHWVRPSGSVFCIPGHERAHAGVPSTVVSSFTHLVCPTGTHEEWFDMPVYDAQTGLFVVGTEPTRVCIPDDLEPEG